MRSPSQAKVSAVSFLIALIISLAVFGFVAYYAISSFMAPEETVDPVNPDEQTDQIVDNEVITPLTPDELESLKGESFTVLVAGYDLQMSGFDAMAVVDVNKENSKVTVYPLNVNTKVYVGHGDSYSLNVRTGDLIKYKDMQYVLDKVNATTGLKIEYFVTFTAEGFIEAFDAFNQKGDYVYKVPKDMEHVYIESSEEATVIPETEVTVPETDAEEEQNELEKYNISFKKGDSLTTGIDVYNMLRYKGDSESERVSRQTAFVKDIVAKIIPARFKEGNLGAIVDTAKALVKLEESITTNITVDVFITEAFDLIAAMPGFSFASSNKYTSGVANFK